MLQLYRRYWILAVCAILFTPMVVGLVSPDDDSTFKDERRARETAPAFCSQTEPSTAGGAAAALLATTACLFRLGASAGEGAAAVGTPRPPERGANGPPQPPQPPPGCPGALFGAAK